MWKEIVARKSEWIGGTLVDSGDNCDRDLGYKPQSTTIILHDHFFAVIGKEFTCGGDTSILGVSGKQEGNGWLNLTGYDSHEWKIKRNTT